MKTEKELRELDAWIAEHVFGDRPDPSKSVHFSSEQYCHPHYSTDPAAAMMVFEKCLNKISTFSIEIYQRVDEGPIFTPCFCICRKGNSMMEDSDVILADTLPIALCLFAKELYSQ